MNPFRQRPRVHLPVLRTFLSLAILCIAISACNSPAQEQAGPSKLYGSWHLISIDGQPIENSQIKSYAIEFLPDSTWRYSSEMSGSFKGMQLKGSGKWSLENNRIQYTAGANKGAANVAFEGAFLRLSPDPVIAPNGNRPATTMYSR